MNDLDFLRKITEISSSSGEEKEVCSFLAEQFSSLGYKVETDNLGNLIAKNYDDGECDILFDAHIDSIGFIVTEILDGGFLKVSPVGGLDERALQSQPVLIKGKRDIFGVVSSVPPHLSDNKKLPAAKDLFIDVGLSKSEDVSLGDRVYFYSPLSHLKNNRITASALDNKISAFTLYKTAKEIRKTDRKIAFLFSTREEVSGKGAAAAAFSLCPKKAVVVDVSFGYLPGAQKRECGLIEGGPLIGFSPVLSSSLSKKAVEVAKKLSIPYGEEVMGSRTGTNADEISISGKGVPTVTVSIPIFNMHTPVETASLIDVDNTAKLLVGLISED